MGIVEKWNNFAKKSLYINNTFEIPCGRLVFVSILTLLESISIFLLTGNIIAIVPLWSNMLLSFSQKSELRKLEINNKKKR